MNRTGGSNETMFAHKPMATVDVRSVLYIGKVKFGSSLLKVKQ